MLKQDNVFCLFFQYIFLFYIIFLLVQIEIFTVRQRKNTAILREHIFLKHRI